MTRTSIKSDIKITVYIVSILSILYYFQDLIKNRIGYDTYIKIFATEPEFKLQIGYIGSIFMHISQYHLIINLCMIIPAVLFLKRYVSNLYLFFLFIISGSSACIGFSIIGDVVNHINYATGSSGVAYGLLANCFLIKLKRFDYKFIKYSIIPLCFIIFESIRYAGYNLDIFVSTSPMSNIAHISSIFLVYIIMIINIRYNIM